MFKPWTLAEVYLLAKLQDITINALKEQLKSTKTFHPEPSLNYLTFQYVNTTQFHKPTPQLRLLLTFNTSILLLTIP